MNRIILLVVLSLLLTPNWTSAAILSFNVLTIDFTNAEDAAAKASWSIPDRLAVTEQGLGWQGERTQLYDGWIETKPMAVGLSWRPISHASLQVFISPVPSSFKLSNGQTSTPYAGQVYVRHSPDLKHWSSWQSLKKDASNENFPEMRRFVGLVGIPQRDREEYSKLLDALRRTKDFVRPDDEEELARSIAKEQPDYFRDHKPFIGYLQFLFEAPFHGKQRIKKLEVHAGWAVSGWHLQPPPDNRDNDRGPWRFVAPE